MWDKERTRAIEGALSQIDRQYGKGAIMRMDDGAVVNAPSVSTGILSLDVAMGIGGMPVGRVVEVYGKESSGKTTLALHAIAEVQKSGGVAAFIDAEHALDVSYARRLGVKVDDLLISQPDYGEQALEITDILVRSGGVDLIVVDSVAALVPRAEINGEMGDSHVGLQARLMSQALRKLTGNLNKSHCTIIFINQLRMKIGVMYGNPEVTTGGNALKFYASIRLDIRRVSDIKQGEQVVGSRVRVKVVKNKLAPPFKVVEFDVMFGTGASKVGDLLDLAAEAGIIKKSGSWYSYGDERIGQGRENAKAFLEERADMAKDLDTKVRAHFAVSELPEPPANADALEAPVDADE
ncbi:MAG: recombinase RecA [Candidatus Lambdaproteobacteria bacterium RIFOXYD2_FULL_50_16]|uniref:Protein RecA n=1 Tax=Candidatus Lambdaproteobacteria bacterium RIFOXYD2_FULL_50_16 TaxID=1817772 RepID=A0A1F6G574_9PROT|nr:MAG: recombinase RecA [Candidatus Lambdaproteobacteria bacterium RIFOXYD2_FULL_50_16]